MLFLNDAEVVVAQAEIEHEFAANVNAVLDSIRRKNSSNVLRLVLPGAAMPPSGIPSDEVLKAELVLLSSKSRLPRNPRLKICEMEVRRNS